MKPGKKKKPISKNENFQFLNFTASLYFKLLYSNIFITLVDDFKKVVICKTSGICIEKNQKKYKISPSVITVIIKELSLYFKIYKIKYVNIILQTRIINSYCEMLFKQLSIYKIAIHGIIDAAKYAHNGTRGRNPRRV